MTLSSTQRRALFKIAVDLVKADNQIHCDELNALEQMQNSFGVLDEDIDLSHYITLSKAIQSLLTLSMEDRQEIVRLLKSIVCADNDIDKRENLMLSAISLSLLSSDACCATIVSTTDSNADFVPDQVIYLERTHCTCAREVLDDSYEYMLLSTLLNKYSLQLFYLPHIIHDLLTASQPTSTASIFTKSLGYIISLDEQNLSDPMAKMDHREFSQFICTRLGIDLSKWSGEAYLVIGIQDGFVLDDDSQQSRCTDFLCIDVSQDIKKRVWDFVQLLSHPQQAISFHGYYRFLYDFLSADRKTRSMIAISPSGSFTLPSLNNQSIDFQSAPQAKALLLLLVFYGGTGIAKPVWQAAQTLLEQIPNPLWENMLQLRTWLLQQGTDEGKLLYNLLILYSFFSHREMSTDQLQNSLKTMILYRSSVKNYINNGFQAVSQLADKSYYSVLYNPITHAYCTPIDATQFMMLTADSPTPLPSSHLWQQLKN